MSDTSVIPVKKTKNIQPAKQQTEIFKEYDREQMISDAAYFRSENRSFEGGNPMSDWLASEAEIDELIKNH